MKKYHKVDATNPEKICQKGSNFVLTYNTHGFAKTLSYSVIGSHDNGWTVEGEVVTEPCFSSWVNDFQASKNDMWVKGNFEEEVKCSSLEALEDFLTYFEVDDWNYEEI